MIEGSIPILLSMLKVCAHITFSHLKLTFHGDKIYAMTSWLWGFNDIFNCSSKNKLWLTQTFIDSAQWWVRLPIFTLVQQSWISFLMKSGSWRTPWFVMERSSSHCGIKSMSLELTNLLPVDCLQYFRTDILQLTVWIVNVHIGKMCLILVP